MFSTRPPVDHRLCFVLMPFRDDLRPVYDVIRRIVESEHALLCRRADDIYSDGIVIEEIWEQICSAHILIADLTGRNPNVFYEVGLAHALSKHVVLVAQNEADPPPFDLRHRRLVIYDPRDLETLSRPLSIIIGQLKWQSFSIVCWLSTSANQIKVGLETPTPGVTLSKSPIEARGRVLGIPSNGLDHSIQAFVRTDKVNADGFWRIDQVHLGARTNRVFFKVFDESGRILATSEELVVSKETRV